MGIYGIIYYLKRRYVMNEIIELVKDINGQLLDGWSGKTYYIEELLEHVFEDGEVVNLPNGCDTDKIANFCEEMQEQLENGVNGIGAIENLIEALFEAYGLGCPAY